MIETSPGKRREKEKKKKRKRREKEEKKKRKRREEERKERWGKVREEIILKGYTNIILKNRDR